MAKTTVIKTPKLKDEYPRHGASKGKQPKTKPDKPKK